MTKHDKDSTNDDRHERYERRRIKSFRDDPEENTHHYQRRRAPYKRSHINYDEYLEDEDGEVWLDDCS